MYAYLGNSEIKHNEGWCSGVPFSSEDASGFVYGDPLTTQQIFEQAVAHFDTAITMIGTASANANLRYFAEVGKARALLSLAKFPEAAAAVADVPLTFKALAQHSNQSASNGIWSAISNGQTRYRLASGEGTNGLKFLDTLSSDPRIKWARSTRIGFSSQFLNQPDQLKFARFADGIIADGIEARLITIEAQLQSAANDQAVFDALNTLRTTGSPTVPVMAASEKPADHTGMVRLFFKERAFWLWLTGHRLGDMRRMVRNYGLARESVFSTGDLGIPYLMTTVPIAGQFGTSTAVTIPFQEKNNPKFKGCLDGV